MKKRHAIALTLLGTTTTFAASPMLALKAAGFEAAVPQSQLSSSVVRVSASAGSVSSTAERGQSESRSSMRVEMKTDVAEPMQAGAPVSVAGFPELGIQPKQEIGAIKFLERFPEYDGRGTVIAIFDTGVDPGAPGLQLTSTGETKIIDVIDATGSGDVDTTTVVELTDDGLIPALSGREIIPPEWPNPTGEYRVGLKAAFELFPGTVDNRIRDDRREAFDEVNRPLLAELRQSIQDWDRANPSPSEDELEVRADLEERFDQLQSLTSNLDDPGPMYDCVVFHDGETFRAVIDTDEDGDLTDETVLTNYRAEQQYATFDSEQLVNYALNIYDEGDTLSIVLDVNGHGTHVAGIAAAHFPGEPELDGVSPGAKIVGVKIGDTRIGTSSHGLGEVRGLIACLQNGVDVINMSYGGGTAYPNEGDVIEHYAEFVYEHGIVFVSSAGNSGPNLSTVGSPGLVEATIGVGASITNEMMKAQYAIRDPYADLQFTWTSRGPAMDGALGVDVTAPGGHISPMPTWTLSGKTQMNGTSMSSPSVAGSVAMLISAMKGEGLEYSPQSIKRALKTTATQVNREDRFSQGYGMISIPDAFDHLSNYEQGADVDVRYAVSIDGDRGVYIREPWDQNRTHEPLIDVNPTFPEDALSQEKVDFEKRVTLVSTADWVSAPESLYMLQSGNAFRAYIDPTGLPMGAHFAEIQGFDAEAPERGPIFRVPVSAIRSGAVPDGAFQKTLEMSPGVIQRHFITVPEGANWADIRIKRLDDDSSRLLVLHTTQLRDRRSFNYMNNETFFRFDDQDETVNSVAVEANGTLELTLAQYWNSLGTGRFEIEVIFEGMHAHPANVAMHSGDMSAQLEIWGALRDDSAAPRASLNRHHRYINPIAAEINAHTTERDMFPDNRNIHQLLLTYELKIEEAASYQVDTSETGGTYSFMAGLVHIYDENNHRVGMGSSWGQVRLEKGTYTVKADFRHAEPSELEKLKRLTLHVSRSISPVSVKASDHGDAFLGRSGAYPSTELEPKQSRALILTVPERSKLPKFAKPGDVLTGSLTVGNTSFETIGAADRPGGVPISLTVGAKLNDLDDSPTAKKDELDDERTEAQKLAHERRELMLKQLKSLASSDDEAAEGLFSQIKVSLLAELRDGDTGLREAEVEAMVLQVHTVSVDRAVHASEGDDPSRVLAAADELRASLDEEAISAFFGRDRSQETAEERELHDLMTARWDALVHALTAVTQSRLDALDALEGVDTEAMSQAFTAAYEELDSWTDITADDHFDLLFTKAQVEGKLGKALKLASSKLKDGVPDRKAMERRIDVLVELGWDHLAELERDRLRDAFRDTLQPY